MVALMDYACPCCGADPEYIEHCGQCKSTGRVRLPAGTIPYRDDNCELYKKEHKPIPDGPFAKVDEFTTNEGHEVRINGEVIEGVSLATVIDILEAADCPHEVETFEFYELIDSNEYPDYHEKDPDTPDIP
jgi:hypothetical protein